MVNCVATTNGIAGGTVGTACNGDITLQLTAGGIITSSTGVGLQANNTGTVGGTAGVLGVEGTGSGTPPPSPAGIWGDASDGIGVVGTGATGVTATGGNTGVRATGGLFGVHADTVSRLGIPSIASVYGQGIDTVGVFGDSTPIDDHLPKAGVAGFSNPGTGVSGQSVSGTGVSGSSNTGPGVTASSDSNSGVWSVSSSGTGVFAWGQGRSPGVAGVSGRGAGVFGTGGGLAGQFVGDVDVSGSVTKTGGGFKIDHPLDPANKYLSHSFVESHERKNVYDGVVVLDANGEAELELPEWFEALNRDFRYQLTAIGAPAPNLYIAQKIINRRFRIAGGSQGLEVSWQVTGIRKDFWAQAHPLTVEAEKPNNERNHYLYPEVHGQPAEKSIAWAQHPEIMRQLMETQQFPPSEIAIQRRQHDELMQR
ncbi:MAG: hypothetical protein JO031_01405, partial [Ktedonobacteraceae bacterium]|nr:hypothetical protein [Ktedonobacteraceae bacterium]